MQRFYQAQDQFEAQMLIDYLRSSHIQATMLGRYQSGAAGELSAFSFPWVWLIEARDLPRATQLLAQFEQQRAQAAPGGDWTCAQCGAEVEGGFDLCWQCGAERPDE